MRLTLRTLLAYLDDTLDPGEIKQIGQKVAESDAAQELIARIKQITRRRRLTTPPLTGPGAKFDANTVAEYLDNDLPSDQVSELEKTCLESDVHLAEIAACHQILTLVLGEPALVPPTAKERMYQLVQGREAIPYRKAPAPLTAASSGPRHDPDPDESPLLGLPFFRRPSWMAWALPAAAGFLVVALGIAIWNALPSKPTQYVAVDPKKPNPAKDQDKDAGPADKDKVKDKDMADPVKEPIKDPMKDPVKDPMKDPVKDPVKDPEPPPRIGRRAPPPRTERIHIGVYQLSDRIPTALVTRARQAGDASYKRLMPGAAVYSSESLMSLPGYTSQIDTKTGVSLTMRGNLPEFSINPLMDSLLEAEVVLHAAPEGIDLDLTLDRGRIYLTSLKENKDAVVRLRFLEQVWDVTLKEGAEVGVDLIKKYPTDVNYLKEEPWASVAFCVLQGKVDVTINGYPKPTKLEAPPGPALLQWDSATDQPPTPIGVQGLPLIWSRKSPDSVLNRLLKEMGDAWEKTKPENAPRLKLEMDYYRSQLNNTKAALLELEALGRDLTDQKPLDSVLLNAREDMKNPYRRHIAVFALGALGELELLLSVLTDEDPEHAPERDNAVFVLRRYLSRGLEASRVLYSEEGTKKSGVLVKKYEEKDAQKVFDLLHDFDPKVLTPETFGLLTYYLKSNNMAVRHLAFWHLLRLSVDVKVPQKALLYNPADPSIPRRNEAASEWQQLVEDKKLPPRR